MHSFSPAYSVPSTPKTPTYRLRRGNATRLSRLPSSEKGTKRQYSPMSPISANECIVNRNMSSSFCSLNWVRLEVWTGRNALSSRGGSSRNSWKMSYGAISVSRLFTYFPNVNRTDFISSRIRHLQDVQITRYNPHKGKPYLFHVVRVLWISTVSKRYQDRFPGASWEEKEGGIDITCCSLVNICIRYVAKQLRDVTEFKIPGFQATVLIVNGKKPMNRDPLGYYSV
jgi:hypothetical protein